MKISVRNVQNVCVLEPQGKITIGEGDVALRNTVKESLQNGCKNILINMSGITYMDDSGIGELVSSYTSSTNKGVPFKLCNVPTKVHDLLQITQLITVFKVYDNEQEALESFN